MTMTVVKPISFTESMLISSTAVEPYLAWVSGTSYAKDVIVHHADPVTGDVREWQSLVNSNTVQPSYTAKSSWLDIGPSNRFAMFDNMISTQTNASSPMVVVFEPGDVISSLALINLVGASVRVEMLQGSTVVYDKTLNLQGSIIADWWDYYFLQDEQVNQALFSDLPLYYAPRIRITLTGLGAANVAIGHAVFGTRQEIGSLEMGATSGIIDYSRKDTDEFGQTSFVRRTFADEFSGQVLVENGQLNRLKRLLRDLRATPCLWIGIDDTKYTETLVVYGWYRQHRIAINYPENSLLDLEIEGLT
jgi:hypothetical protein